MKAIHSGILECQRHIERQRVIDLAAAIVTLAQPDAASFDYIYCRYDFNHSSRKFLIINAPTSPLFSGWNWVP